jgi:hypothetical protein
VGDPVDHGFAQITFSGCRYFGFTHGMQRKEKPGGFNVQMQSPDEKFNRQCSTISADGL